MVKSNNTIKSFWIAFFATLSALLIAVSIFTFVTMSDKIDHMKATVVEDADTYKISTENSYRSALYETCENLKGIDAAINKVCISADSSKQIQYLMDVSTYAASLSCDVSRLPTNQGEIVGMVDKFANQLNYYTKSLASKLADGDELALTDKTALLSLDATTTALYNSLNEMATTGSGMYITNSLFTDGANMVGDTIDEMNKEDLQYSDLVYDGPYSDSIEHGTMVINETIDPEEGLDVVRRLFSGENINSITFVTTMKKEGLLYVYEVDTTEGSVDVIVTADGRLYQFDYYLDSTGNAALYEGDGVMSLAKQFAQSAGFDVESLYITKVQDFVAYVTLAPIADGVIVYPDAVVVAVDTTRGEIVGFVGKGYLTNHRDDRDVKFGAFDFEQASNRYSGRVVSAQKAIIAKYGKEYACYEYEVDTLTQRYFVYVDSNTGKEVDIFMVVDEAEGFSVI
jgi:germination protein YpeB